VAVAVNAAPGPAQAWGQRALAGVEREWALVAVQAVVLDPHRPPPQRQR
jgi:hypothetical protein